MPVKSAVRVSLGIFLLFFLIFEAFIFNVPFTLGATITWDGGGGDNNWSTCANWSSDTCPGSADVATFNNTSTKDAIIDASFAGSVSGINIASGYTGTITMERSLTVGSGHYTQAAGTFAQGSNTLTLTGNFTKTGGTFDPGTGTVAFNPSTTRTYNVDVTETFYNVTKSGSSLTISSGDTMVVTGTLTVNDGQLNTGTIDARGDITIAVGADGGSVIIDFGNDAVAQTMTIDGGRAPVVRFNSAADANDSVVFTADSQFDGLDITSGFSGTVPMTYNSFNFTIGTVHYIQAAGTFIAPSTLTLNGNFTKTGGEFDEGTGTVIFTGGASTATYNVDATETFHNIQVNKNITISSGDTIVVAGTLTVNDGQLNTGTIDARGDITFAAGADGGSAILDFGNDAVAQTMTVNGGRVPAVRFDSAADANDSVIFNADTQFDGLNITSGFAGTVPLTYNGYNLTIGTVDYIQAAGTFIAPATLTINSLFTKTGGSFVEGTGTVVFNPSSSSRTYDVDVTETFYNVTKTSSNTLIIASGDTMVVTGTLTLTDGLVNTGTLEAQGNVVVVSTYDGGTSPLKFSGSATQSFDLTSATTLYNGDITIDKSGGKVNLASALVMDASNQDLIVTNGTFNLNGNNLTVNGSSSTLVVQDGGTLELQGGETITANATYPSLQSGSTVKYSGTSGPYTLKDYGYHHLTIDGSGATFNQPATLDVNGNLTISAGTLDATASDYSLTVAGNWSNTGTFTARSGTVTLDGASQTITGTTTFNNLSKTVASAATLTFGANQTQTISGTWTAQGAAGQLLSLRSSANGTQWKIDPQSTRTIAYLDVKDSNNTNSTVISAVNTNSTDSGNNTNWDFIGNTAPDTPTDLSPADGAWTTDNTPTLSFTTADTDGDMLRSNIQIDDSSDFSSLVVDAYTDFAAAGHQTYTSPTLSDGSYYWRVRTFDGTATSSFATANSGDIAFKVDATAPTAGSVATSTVAATSITVTSSGATDATSGTSTFQFLESVTDTYSGATTSLSWTFSSLIPNTEYSFTIGVYDAAGNSATTSALTSYTYANAPTSLTLTVDSSSQITVSWNANSNPVGTEYYVENTTAGTNSGWTTATQWVFNSLSAATAYTFEVKARNGDLVETASVSDTATTSSESNSGGGSGGGGQSRLPATRRPTELSIVPMSVILLPSEKVRFVAIPQIAGGVTWSVKETSGGVIDVNGLYTAPAKVGTYTVVLQSIANPQLLAHAKVFVIQKPSSQEIVISPRSLTLTVGGSFKFSSNIPVRWGIDGQGTITQEGVYRAPSVPGTYFITAQSLAESSVSARAQVAVVEAASTADPISIIATTTPKTVVDLTAFTEEYGNLRWEAEGAGNIVKGGAGYLSPATAGVYSAVAYSAIDRSIKILLTIIVRDPIAVTISPLAVTLAPGTAFPFTAHVSGADNTNVIWRLEKGTEGTISKSGVYTAPMTPGTYYVTALSEADATSYARAEVTIPGPRAFDRMGAIRGFVVIPIAVVALLVLILWIIRRLYKTR